MYSIWPAEQVKWDSKLDIEKYVWTDKKFKCNVWNVETNEYCYRTSLTKANREKNHRVRFGWNESLTSSIDYWSQRDASFDCFIGTELLTTNDDEAIKRITTIMKPEAKFVLLEPVDSIDEPSIRRAGLEDILFITILIHSNDTD
uniref:Methyltransf_11 domain-containing protein n=1 Tax=Angiostrongylus cantonensis TaxID=6313 RepID=A0A158PCS7_ANGCA